MPPRRGQRRAEEQRQEPGPLQELLAEINAEPDHNSEDEDGGDLDVPELPCAPDGSRTGRLSREELAALATEAKRQQEKSTSRTYKNNLKWFKEWGGPRGLSPENFDVPDAVRFYSDVLQAMQRDADSCNYPKALNTIKGWHSALQDVWKQKCMSLSDLDAANSPNHMKLLDYPTYKTAYHNLQKYVSSLTPSDPTRGSGAAAVGPRSSPSFAAAAIQGGGSGAAAVGPRSSPSFAAAAIHGGGSGAAAVGPRSSPSFAAAAIQGGGSGAAAVGPRSSPGSAWGYGSGSGVATAQRGSFSPPSGAGGTPARARAILDLGAGSAGRGSPVGMRGVLNLAVPGFSGRGSPASAGRGGVPVAARGQGRGSPATPVGGSHTSPATTAAAPNPLSAAPSPLTAQMRGATTDLLKTYAKRPVVALHVFYQRAKQQDQSLGGMSDPTFLSEWARVRGQEGLSGELEREARVNHDLRKAAEAELDRRGKVDKAAKKRARGGSDSGGGKGKRGKGAKKGGQGVAALPSFLPTQPLPAGQPRVLQLGAGQEQRGVGQQQLGPGHLPAACVGGQQPGPMHIGAMQLGAVQLGARQQQHVPMQQLPAASAGGGLQLQLGPMHVAPMQAGPMQFGAMQPLGMQLQLHAAGMGSMSHVASMQQGGMLQAAGLGMQQQAMQQAMQQQAMHQQAMQQQAMHQQALQLAMHQQAALQQPFFSMNMNQRA